MTNLSSLVLPIAEQVIVYGQKLLADIPADKFARKPFQDSKVTPINHPAFQYGHLALYPLRIAGLLGLAKDGVEVPSSYIELFKKGSPCTDDVEGKIYPSMDLITNTYFNTHREILKKLQSVSDQEYFRINTEEASKDRFPTVGSFVIYLLSAHANTHFGQVCAWRRCMGLAGV